MKSLLPGVVASVFALLFAASAFAHAEPSTAKPGDGAVLLSSPAEIVLEMSQELTRQAGANDIDVLDASGKEVTAVAAVVDNGDRRRLSVPLPASLPPGNYTVKWKTLSAEDGDPAQGALSFTLDPNATANPGKEQLRDDLLGGGSETGAGETPPSIEVPGSSSGVTWILVAAVGIGMFVLGAGGTFLLVQKNP